MKFFSGDLNLDPCPPKPHNYLYLWSDHLTKDVQ